jgi:hypothetical protein
VNAITASDVILNNLLKLFGDMITLEGNGTLTIDKNGC